MSMPFYVSPEQVMADKAEYARKGIARGKSSVTLEYDGGILLMAENPSTLSKIGEIYDRVAFAGVGKFSEFDQLRKVGVRYADVKGYSWDIFTRELKPLEVEMLVAEVGDDSLAGHEKNAIYRVQFDGSISDHEGFCVIGGAADELIAFLKDEYRDELPLGEVMRLGRNALQRAADGEPLVDPRNLEVCLLERARPGRKFNRLSTDQVREHLGE
jgi:proteasome alpha subunit